MSAQKSGVLTALGAGGAAPLKPGFSLESGGASCLSAPSAPGVVDANSGALCGLGMKPQITHAPESPLLARETPASTCPERRRLGGLAMKTNPNSQTGAATKAATNSPDDLGAKSALDQLEQDDAQELIGPERVAPQSIGLILDPPSDEERKALLDDFFGRLGKVRGERREAAQIAAPALERLCQAMTRRSGQCYKVRALLYSLYNGQATELIEILGLDWEIRKDLCAVLLAFGFQSRDGFPQPLRDGGDSPDFFYAAMKTAIVKAGQWEWFVEAHQEEEQ